MSRILVIGATGNIGREVVLQLPAAGAQVRALSRKPAESGLPPGVEAVYGDLTLPETLEAPLDGVDAVFLVWTAPPPAAGPALERILARTPRIVLLTSPHKTPHPFFQQPNPVRHLHAELERIIEQSDREWTFLRPGMLNSNARFWWGPQIRAGEVVRWPYLSVATTPIDERDIAAVAVRALCENGHAGVEYLVTGPESLTQAAQIETIGRAIGRDVRYEELTPDEARTALLPLMPLFIIDMLLSAWGAAVGLEPFMTRTVQEITGRPARTYFEWASDNAADFS